MAETADKTPEAWRREMVEALKALDALNGMDLPASLERALLEVPRHLFAPGADLEAAHSPFAAVETKWDERG
ncbi:hypothetical protein ACFQXA_08955 [Nocardiopsis composta]